MSSKNIFKREKKTQEEEEVALDPADSKLFEFERSLRSVVDSRLATSLLHWVNFSALRDIHTIAKRLMIWKGDRIYPIDWNDLHNVARVRTEVSTLFALSLMKMTADLGSWPI